jgi:hypothetical protein
MALAKYFSKDLLAINQVLKRPADLQAILDKVTVGIYFSENAASTREGLTGVELSVRLLARLYPTLRIESLSDGGKNLEKKFRTLAREINELITIPEGSGVSDIAVIIGSCDEKIKAEHKLYIGSDKWLGSFSTSKDKACGDSFLPFGIGTVACIAASNVFRIVFKEFLSDLNKPDEDFNISALDFGLGANAYNPELKDIELKPTVLVGLGAIGSAVAWTLSKLSISGGSMDFVDKEPLGLTNLQRYILFTEKDLDKSKTEIAKEHFNESKLHVQSHPLSWAQYQLKTKNQPIGRVAIAVDNKEDRITIQSSLPRTITNSFTDINVLRVARHMDFNDKRGCVACGFVTDEKLPSYTEEVAINLNIENINLNAGNLQVNIMGSDLINIYMNENTPVNNFVPVKLPIPIQINVQLLDVISQVNKIDRAELNRFHGMQVRQFYSTFICGGISIEVKLVNKVAKNVDAPLAFQSALAGILLGSELVMQDTGIRVNEPKQAVQFFPLYPIKEGNNPQLFSIPKNKTGRCLCIDQDFQERYNEKWSKKVQSN